MRTRRRATSRTRTRAWCPAWKACRQSIGQDVYDAIRNDFDEANTIYREEGLALPGLGGDEDAEDSLGEDPEGGDEL